MARPSRSAMYSDDATFLWKPILRFLAILLAIVAIGTTAWAMISHIQGPNTYTDTQVGDTDDYDTDYFSGDYYLLPWQFITLGLSILWNIANIATLLVRNRAIHPGANVACDLLLWLGLLITSGFAALGATTRLSYTSSDEYYEDVDSPYGGGSYNNGTQFEYTANGTMVPVNSSTCVGFTTCAERNHYVSAINHKGVVIAVGASMAFVVLLFHFALFISACRYTHARRHSNTSRQARAITAEATEIARKMITDMTGPNGGFIPRNQAQQGGSYQPLRHSDAGDAMEMRQRQSRTQTGYDYQPVQQGEVEEGEDSQPSQDDVNRRRYEQTAPTSPVAESSSAARSRGKQRVVSGLDSEIHPALRNDPDLIAQAI